MILRFPSMSRVESVCLLGLGEFAPLSVTREHSVYVNDS